VLLTIWMTDHLCDDGGTSGPNLAVEPLYQVESTGSQFPSPTLITKAMVPKPLPRKGRNWVCSVSYEAASCVRVEGQQERNEQVMRVPESLERLLSDAMVGSGIHKHHAQKHDMAGDSTCFSIMHLDSLYGADLVLLDVVETLVD
jgi:hypothetical protein